MDYSELKFTNNFIFCKVLENNLDLCKELLKPSILMAMQKDFQQDLNLSLTI